MKVLLNMAAERVAQLGEWAECEAVRLVECSDGSLNLELTRDIEATRSSEARMAELLSKGEAGPGAL